jgi:hypothetical protein
VAICKHCFTSNYHEQHQFVTRKNADSDWQPAIKEGGQKNDTEYKRLMEEL